LLDLLCITVCARRGSKRRSAGLNAEEKRQKRRLIFFTVVFYGLKMFLPQNGAILRNASQTGLVRITYEKHAAQHFEDLCNSLGH